MCLEGARIEWLCSVSVWWSVEEATSFLSLFITGILMKFHKGYKKEGYIKRRSK